MKMIDASRWVIGRTPPHDQRSDQGDRAEIAGAGFRSGGVGASNSRPSNGAASAQGPGSIETLPAVRRPRCSWVTSSSVSPTVTMSPVLKVARSVMARPTKSPLAEP